MKRNRTLKVKYYTVHWFSNGFCYRTTMGCDIDDVKNLHDKWTDYLIENDRWYDGYKEN